MKCWICQTNDADSGEHSIKKSDLKALYPNTTQDSPINHSRNGVKKRPIRSIKSKAFKYEKVICEDCNNSKTQAYDETWEVLHKYLSGHWSEIIKNDGFYLDKIFQCETEKKMKNVQLFFIKLFGCKIKQSGKSNALSDLSKSLLMSEEHPNVYISFRDSANELKNNHSVNSDVQVYKEHGKLKYMHWFYTVGKITVDLIYSPDVQYLELNGALLELCPNLVYE